MSRPLAALVLLAAISASAAEMDASLGFAAPSKRSQIPPPPARRETMTPEDGAALVAAWTKILGTLESGRDLAAFLRTNPVPVRVDQRLRGMGLYENKTIFIHEGMLTYKLEHIEGKLGLREGAALEALAWSTVHVFAHEVEHAATRRRLASETGAPYEHPDRDDELLSLAREVRVLREIDRRFPAKRVPPAYAGSDDFRTEEYMRGLGPDRFAEVEQMAARTFSSLPCLRLADRAKQKTDSETLAAYWKSQKNDRDAAGGEAKARQVAAVASDPNRFAALKAHFQRRHDELAALWPRLP